MGKTFRRIALTAIIFASGYYFANNQEPILEIAAGLYNKSLTAIKQPIKNLYNWATEQPKPSELEQKMHENYQ